MRAVTRIKFDEVTRQVAATLNQLGFSYLKSGNKTLEEFEIQEPSRFRVSVELVRNERVGLFLLRSTDEETLLQIHRDLETERQDLELEGNVSSFVEKLIDGLPNKPWEGLGMVKSRTEKTKWLELDRV